MRSSRNRHSSDNFLRPQGRGQISRATNYSAVEQFQSTVQASVGPIRPGVYVSQEKLRIEDSRMREPPTTIHSSMDRRIYYVVRSGQNNTIRVQKKPTNPLGMLQAPTEKAQILRQGRDRPQTSRELPGTLLESSVKLRHTFTSLASTDLKKPKVNIMNLQLAAGDEDAEKRRQVQLEQIEMFKVMIEKRKQQRFQQRERERERFRQKCMELLHRNQKIKFEEQQPNFKLIRQIISELKLSRNLPNHEDHLRILALESNGRKSATAMNSPKKSELAVTELRLSNSKPLLKSRKKIEKMVFSISDQTADKVYKKKIESYLEFLYKVNFSNCIYVDLRLSEEIAGEGNNNSTSTPPTRYKVFVGKGNNSLLIKSLIKRRFWLELVDSKSEEGINFYWTQSKLKEVHAGQEETSHKPLPEAIKRKQMGLRSKKLPPEGRQDNLKLMGRSDSLMVENYLSAYSVKGSIYDKFKATIVTNHIPQNSIIGSKKALFHSLYHYYKHIVGTDPFQFIPHTFHVRGTTDQSFKEFMEYSRTDRDKVWILKPGENSNRGNGISLVHAKEIYPRIQKIKNHANGQPKTYIIQSYINRPFLYHNRKFDIRHYMMITSVNGLLKAFWYQEGYIRTSSYQYDIEDLDNNLIHLTNDAIQKYGDNYSRYEPGNKLSYSEFQRYLDMNFTGKKYNFDVDILPKMKEMAADAIRANFHRLDVKRKLNNFEVFGLDFMIDNHFKPWLIEINFNPCLEISSALLSRIIPGMIESSMRLGLDPLFPPPSHYPPMRRYQLSDNILQNFKFECIFDQKTEGEQLRKQHKAVSELVPDQLDDISDHQEQYEDEGQEVQLEE